MAVPPLSPFSVSHHALLFGGILRHNALWLLLLLCETTVSDDMHGWLMQTWSLGQKSSVVRWAWPQHTFLSHNFVLY